MHKILWFQTHVRYILEFLQSLKYNSEAESQEWERYQHIGDSRGSKVFGEKRLLQKRFSKKTIKITKRLTTTMLQWCTTLRL